MPFSVHCPLAGLSGQWARSSDLGVWLQRSGTRWPQGVLVRADVLLLIRTLDLEGAAEAPHPFFVFLL